MEEIQEELEDLLSKDYGITGTDDILFDFKEVLKQYNLDEVQE